MYRLAWLALAATEGGRWAVVHDHGALYGHGPQQEGSIDLLGATAAAFADDQTLAVLGEGGQLEICDLRSHRQTAVELGVRCDSIAWSALGWWAEGTRCGPDHDCEQLSEESYDGTCQPRLGAGVPCNPTSHSCLGWCVTVDGGGDPTVGVCVDIPGVCLHEDLQPPV